MNFEPLRQFLNECLRRNWQAGAHCRRFFIVFVLFWTSVRVVVSGTTAWPGFIKLAQAAQKLHQLSIPQRTSLVAAQKTKRLGGYFRQTNRQRRHGVPTKQRRVTPSLSSNIIRDQSHFGTPKRKCRCSYDVTLAIKGRIDRLSGEPVVARFSIKHREIEKPFMNLGTVNLSPKY
ncbi:MAG: hypothetical protein WCQ21_12585 [Verrucomicrobiota bacterium]